MDRDAILDRIEREAPTVVVYGDLLVDDWWTGSAGRLAREAPVPVVTADGHAALPGGAANTALAVAALGGRVSVIGAVGEDAAGGQLLDALAEAGVDVSGVLRSSRHCTPLKTRIVAGDTILARIDEASRGLDPELAELLRRMAWERAQDPRAVQLVCDYALGTAEAMREPLAAAPRPSLRIVDAHDPGAWAVLSPDVVTPNWEESLRLLDGLEAAAADGRPAAIEACQAGLLAASAAAAVLVTLDREGSLLLRPGAEPHRTRATPAPEQNCIGAGDSFTAALALALGVGAPAEAAADFAQAAADVVVRRPGTSCCTAAELRAGTVMRSWDRVAAFVAERRRSGCRIVLTNGCFDVLHRGHTACLAEARQLGDVLIVALNSDDSVRRLKGDGRPLNSFEDRAAVLAALESVDAVTEFAQDTPAELIELLRPDVYAKGGDYTESMLAEEGAVVRGYGGEVRTLGYVAQHSTTELVERIRRPEARSARRGPAQWAASLREGGDGGCLDVLIPTRGRPAELAVTLSGLAGQHGPAFRVLISDQSEGTPDYEHPAAAAMVRLLRAQGRPVLLQRNLPRLGMAQQRAFLLRLSLDTAPEATEVLYLDDDVWLEPGEVHRMCAVLRERQAGFVGEAVQGLSYLGERRPEAEELFEAWTGAVGPEQAGPGTQAAARWPLHSAANLVHLADRLGLEPGETLAYRVAWVGGCVLFDRAALVEAGGFDFWRDLPPEHAGEDVVAQWRVMARVGGAGILPSGAVHLESPTTVADRTVNAAERIPIMPDTPNPVQVQKFLGGLDYPVDKQTLLDRARESGADDAVLGALEALPDGEYDAPTAVSSALADAD